jgi:MFS family permease
MRRIPPSIMDAATSEPRLLTHRETQVVIFGALLPVFMGALDNTVLASVLPTIARDLGDLHNVPWLITAYLIAATSALPLHGKISDIHGRRVALQIAIGIYMAGSLACALAPDMLTLILARVLHGLGGGGLSAIGMVILGDLAAPKDRARYYGYFSVVFATAGACGPALGGFIADHVSWVAIFWMNVGMGVVALALTSTLLRRLPRRERPHRLDFLGAALIMAASVAAMLAMSMGGVRYAWTSPSTVALAAAALALGALFVWRLRTAPEPLIPLSILGDPVARYSVLAHALGWAAIIGLNIFLPMYLQNVLGYSATAAGLSLMVIMAGLNTSAWGMTSLIGRMTRYKLAPMVGLCVSIAAVLGLAWQAEHMNFLVFEALLAAMGIGFGGIPALTTVALQNTVAPYQLGTAMGTMAFCRGLFATMTVALLGVIVMGGVAAEPGPIGHAVAVMSAVDFARVFYAAAAILAVALVCVVLTEEKPLRAEVAEGAA